jgi:hypothetical protein
MHFVFAIRGRLTNENYLWQWLSFIGFFCVAFFVLIYGFWYFAFRTEVEGWLQVLYFLAYTAILGCIIGVVFGFVGLAASAIFVRRISAHLKVDGATTRGCECTPRNGRTLNLKQMFIFVTLFESHSWKVFQSLE